MQTTAGSVTDCLVFAEFTPKDRFELSLACEIWLDDACNARWATNNSMKLAAVIVQGIKNNDGRGIEISRLDQLCAMTRDDANNTLRQMRIFGLIADYRLEHGRIGATCCLSHAGQIRFLDMKHKFDVLDQLGQSGKAHAAEPAEVAASIASSIAITTGNVVAFRSRESGRLNPEPAHELVS